MICAKCGASLGQVNAAGEPMLRTRGLVLKADRVEAVCPKCKAGVPLSGEFARALGHRLVLPRTPRPRPA